MHAQFAVVVYDHATGTFLQDRTSDIQGAHSSLGYGDIKTYKEHTHVASMPYPVPANTSSRLAQNAPITIVPRMQPF
jgi:hypothetical protein